MISDVSSSERSENSAIDFDACAESNGFAIQGNQQRQGSWVVWGHSVGRVTVWAARRMSNAAYEATVGRRSVKVVPRLGMLATAMVPPCRSTIDLQMARPSPPLRAASEWVREASAL